MTMNDRLSGNLSDEEYLQRLRTKIAEKRVPYTGSVELTHRCNLKCMHCYLGDQCSISKETDRELATEPWIDIIDQIVEAQCLDLLITGGEPMLRKDFPEIYAHGSTAATHDRITQVKGSHAKCMKGVEALLKLGVRVGLKTVLMSLNKHEYADMENLARELNVPWRLDSAVFPCLPNSDSGGQPNRCSLFTMAGDRKAAAKSPLSLRVDPQDAVALEFSDGARVKAMRGTFAKMSGRKVSEKLYTCGAGLTGFHVDPYGCLQPCMMTTGYRQKIVGSSFEKAWREIGRVRDVPAPAGYACGACDKLSICSGCPALFDLENGAAGVRSEYICALTQFRFDSIQNEQG